MVKLPREPLTKPELRKAAVLMIGLLRSIRDIMIEIREEVSCYIAEPDADPVESTDPKYDPEEQTECDCEECTEMKEFDLSMLQIAQAAEGLRFIIDSHLDGTTSAGFDGLISRLARNPDNTSAK